jgi:hypothetical protein
MYLILPNSVSFAWFSWQISYFCPVFWLVYLLFLTDIIHEYNNDETHKLHILSSQECHAITHRTYQSSRMYFTGQSDLQLIQDKNRIKCTTIYLQFISNIRIVNVFCDMIRKHYHKNALHIHTFLQCICNLKQETDVAHRWKT